MAVNGYGIGSGPIGNDPHPSDAGLPGPGAGQVEPEHGLFVGGPLHGQAFDVQHSTIVVPERYQRGPDPLFDVGYREVTYTRHTVVHPVGDRRYARRVWVDTRLTGGGQPDRYAFERMVDAVVALWASGGVLVDDDPGLGGGSDAAAGVVPPG